MYWRGLFALLVVATTTVCSCGGTDRATSPGRPKLDGTVAVVAGEPGNEILFVTALDGSNERRVTLPLRRPEVGSVAFSPDGRRIAFVAREEMNDRSRLEGLYVADVATGRARQLSLPPGAFIHAGVAWSSDGERLAFTSEAGQAAAGENAGLYAVDVDEGSVRKLAGLPPWIAPSRDDPRWLESPLWSPASPSSLAYLVMNDSRPYDWRESLLPPELAYLGGNGLAPRRLATVSVWGFPAWSPDGTRIAYVEEQDTALEVVDVRSGRRKEIATGIAPIAIRWTPRGIYGSRCDAYCEGTRAVVIDPETGAVENLRPIADAYESVVGASPNGDQVALFSEAPSQDFSGTDDPRLHILTHTGEVLLRRPIVLPPDASAGRVEVVVDLH